MIYLKIEMNIKKKILVKYLIIFYLIENKKLKMRIMTFIEVKQINYDDKCSGKLKKEISIIKNLQKRDSIKRLWNK